MKCKIYNINVNKLSHLVTRFLANYPEMLSFLAPVPGLDSRHFSAVIKLQPESVFLEKERQCSRIPHRAKNKNDTASVKIIVSLLKHF